MALVILRSHLFNSYPRTEIAQIVEMRRSYWKRLFNGLSKAPPNFHVPGLALILVLVTPKDYSHPAFINVEEKRKLN